MTYSITYLPKIHVETKSFQSSLQQDLPWQLATGIKDNVALNAGLHVVLGHAELVAARLCGVVCVCVNFLQGIHYLPTEPGVIMKCKTIS